MGASRGRGVDWWLATGAHPRAGRAAGLVRVVVGVLFVVFAVPKFTDHARWVADVGTYGLPASDALVYAIGTAELVGGLALVAGLVVRPVAALLALLMVGAVVAGGVVGGNPLSFTLAPALLVGAAFVVWSTVERRDGRLRVA